MVIYTEKTFCIRAVTLKISIYLPTTRPVKSHWHNLEHRAEEHPGLNASQSWDTRTYTHTTHTNNTLHTHTMCNLKTPSPL